VYGNNGAHRGKGYPAQPGYDHPTGWGVPKATELVQWLSGHPAPQVAPLPPPTATMPALPEQPAPGLIGIQQPHSEQH